MRWISRLEEASAGEACAWIVRLDDPAAARAAAAPTPADLRRAAQANAADGGAARLWRRRLTRALAGRTLGVHPDAIVFPDGEPRPARLLAPAPLYVSAATRGPWTVVAAGPAPLGVDVELMDRDLAALGGSSPATLRRWTAAEAYVKASGCDLDAAWSACADSRLNGPRARLRIGEFTACAISWRPLGALALAAAAQAPAERTGWMARAISGILAPCRPDAPAS